MPSESSPAIRRGSRFTTKRALTTLNLPRVGSLPLDAREDRPGMVAEGNDESHELPGSRDLLDGQNGSDPDVECVES